MNLAAVATTLVALITGAYGLHGFITETGVVGWIIYAQQAMFGSASMKLTFLIVTVAVTILTVITYAVIPSKTAAAAEQSKLSKALFGDPNDPNPIKTAARNMILLIPVVWVIGYGCYWWAIYGEQQDARATYERVALADAKTAPTPNGSYVALTGRAMGDAIIQHTQGRSSSSSSSIQYYLVPIVAPDWTKGQPVHYVMKVPRLEDLGLRAGAAVPIMRGSPYDKAALAARFGWLGHLEGAPPVPAAQAFKNLGVVMSDTAQLVRWIPSQDGKPAVADDGESYRLILYIICGALTAIFLILALAWWWRGNRQEAKAARERAAA